MAESLLVKVQEEIKKLAKNGKAYTSLDAVPHGKALQEAAKQEGKPLHQRYLFGGLRFVNF